jgi:hypothetical protein
VANWKPEFVNPIWKEWKAVADHMDAGELVGWSTGYHPSGGRFLLIVQGEDGYAVTCTEEGKVLHGAPGAMRPLRRGDFEDPALLKVGALPQEEFCPNGGTCTGNFGGACFMRGREDCLWCCYSSCFACCLSNGPDTSCAWCPPCMN